MPDPFDMDPGDTWQMPIDLAPSTPTPVAEPPVLDSSEDSVSKASTENQPPPPETAHYDHLLLEKDSGGIEILVQMAQKGDIDPKNIDIIDACDRFLKAIAAAPRENLRRSGQIIFHASVLLRLTADALLLSTIADLDIGGAASSAGTVETNL